MKSKRVIILSLATIVIADWYVREFVGWQSATIQLDAESSLRISRKQTHPFFAEYERKVAVFRSGKRLATLRYPHDSGGGFPIQVRLYAGETRRVVRMTDLFMTA